MSPEATLEGALGEIRRLDTLRNEARALREKGLGGLCKDYGASRSDWYDPGDYVERSILVGVWGESLAAGKLSESQEGTFRREREKLAALGLATLFRAKNPLEPPAATSAAPVAPSGATPVSPPGPAAAASASADILDHVPVLRSAAALRAMSSLPGFALSAGALNGYFRIAYELNFTASPDDDLPGGASPGGRGVPQTAFMTWACVRAVIAFAHTFDATATLLAELETVTQARPTGVPAAWWAVHLDNVRFAANITVQVLKRNALIALDDRAAHLDFAATLSEVKQACAAAAERLRDMPTREALGVPSTPASDAVDPYAYEKARTRAADLVKQLSDVQAGTTAARIVDALRNAARSARRTLDPVTKFLHNVINHELAAGVSESQRVPDAAELLFAADALAQLAQLDELAGVAAAEDDPGARAALARVVPLMSNHGRVPSHRPFDVIQNGYVLHVSAAEVIGAFATLARRLNHPVTADVIEKLLRHFHETWQGDDLLGWRHERDGANGKCQWWLSGISVQALGEVIRLVDARVNRMVLKYFSVRQPQKTGLTLDALFYADYGLVAAGIRPRSVAMELQRMRAHLYAVAPPKTTSPLHSVILHGPPGTGKTTLVEALARTAQVFLVEVTPSDIVLAGVEQIEGRARAVFEALSMLSGVVILFDEFDSILLQRAKSAALGGILQFVTPGMLPKLKTLNDNAQQRHVAFALSTNRIGALDDAAIREGRFDAKLGVYPPDALSRAGRLWMGVSSLSTPPSEPQKARIAEVIEQSGGLPMERLGKPDWFSSPRNPSRASTPFAYIRSGEGDVNWPDAEKTLPAWPGADYGIPERDAENASRSQDALNESAYREWMEWKFVDALDALTRASRAHAMLERFDDPTHALHDTFKMPAECSKHWVAWRGKCDTLGGSSGRAAT